MIIMNIQTVIQNSSCYANSTNFTQFETIIINGSPDNQFLPLIAILISAFSVVVGFTAVLLQKRHNHLTVKPLGNVEIHDTVSEISISICNSGTGPMIIKTIETKDQHDIKKNHPADWVPWRDLTAPHYFKSFKENDNIKSGTSEIIFRYNFESESGSPREHRMSEERKLIRNILKNLRISIEYTNIYGDKFQKIDQKLEGFASE